MPPTPSAARKTGTAAGATGPPHDGRIDGCTCFRVRRLARRVTQIYDRTLAPCGLRVTQFSVLARLAWYGPMAMGPLAAMLDMDRTTLTRNLKPLLDAGLVTLERSSIDARQREVRITSEGRTRQRLATKLWRVAQDEINETIGSAQVVALHALFDGLIDTLHDNRRSGAPSA